MSDSQKLKDRFNKLQVQINPTVPEPVKPTTEPTQAQAELPSSLQPELHQVLRNSDTGKISWKKILRSKSQRVSISGSNERTFLMLERAIQQIAKKRIIVSVCKIRSEDEDVLNKLTQFMKSRINLFKDFFDTATVCLVRVHKARSVIEVNSFESGATEFLRQRLELEAARSGSSLNSFQIDTKDGWLSLSVNLSEKPIRSFEEISQ